MKRRIAFGTCLSFRRVKPCYKPERSEQANKGSLLPTFIQVHSSRKSVCFSPKNICFLAFLLFFGCDEGKIYPEKTIDTGRTATITLSFEGLGAWPKKNYLSIAGFKAGEDRPILAKRINNPNSEEKELTLTLNGLEKGINQLCVSIISNGQNLVYTYSAYPIDDTMEHITIPPARIHLATFDRVQQQVFNLNCTACHGGSTHLAGNLDLTEESSYRALVNVEAPLSEAKKLYVAPGKPEESFLLDILQENTYHSDLFNSTGKQEVLGLIKTWISEGAEEK